MIVLAINRAAQTTFMPFHVCQVDASAFCIVDAGMLLARDLSEAPKHHLVLIWQRPIGNWTIPYCCFREQMYEIYHSRPCRKYPTSLALKAMLQQVACSSSCCPSTKKLCVRINRFCDLLWITRFHFNYLYLNLVTKGPQSLSQEDFKNTLMSFDAFVVGLALHKLVHNCADTEICFNTHIIQSILIQFSNRWKNVSERWKPPSLTRASANSAGHPH